MKRWTYHSAADLHLSFCARNRSMICECGLARSIAHEATWILIRRLIRHRHKLDVFGDHQLPVKGPFILVSNHCSHLDALILGASVPAHRAGAITPLAAGDTFFRSPTRAALASIMLHALPVWRGACGHESLGTLRRRLTDSLGSGADAPVFVMFPEGTRSRTGEMGPFKAGIGALVAGTSVPVVPARIGGSFEAWPPHEKRPGRAPVAVRLGAPMTFERHPNHRQGWRAIASAIEGRVRELRMPPFATARERTAGRFATSAGW